MADKKVSEINAANLRIQGEAGNQYVEVDGLKIRLSRPMDLPFKWVGNKKLVDTIVKFTERSRPLLDWGWAALR